VRTWVRRAADREPQPSGAIVDSQTVRTSKQGGIRGYDAKKVCGRKRHLLFDTLRLMLLVVITAANVQIGTQPGLVKLRAHCDIGRPELRWNDDGPVCYSLAACARRR